MTTKKKVKPVKKLKTMTTEKAEEEFEKFREVELAKLRDYKKEMSRPDFITQVIRQTYMQFYADAVPAWSTLDSYVTLLENMIEDLKLILTNIDYNTFVSTETYDDPYKKYIIRRESIKNDEELFKAFIQYQIMAPFGEQLMRAWMAARDAQKEIEVKQKADKQFADKE
jgi:hypothetical protein